MVTVWSPEPEMVFRVKYQLLTSVTQFCKVHREQPAHKISVKATIWSLSGLGDGKMHRDQSLFREHNLLLLSYDRLQDRQGD